jgi:hypothetical protein
MSGTCPAAAAATRRRPLFRSAAAIGVTLDPDNGKDQDRPHAFALGSTCAWAQPPRTRICREFNDGAHVTFSSPHRLDPAAAGLIKIRAWLMAC